MWKHFSIHDIIWYTIVPVQILFIAQIFRIELSVEIKGTFSYAIIVQLNIVMLK